MGPLLLLGVGFLLLATVSLLKAFFKSHHSPLSEIPDAGYGASYSRLFWAFPHEYLGRITLDLPKLHSKLGPLLRIGPNEVSFYSIEAYDAVHRVHGGFTKDPRTYGQFVQDGHPALFSITHEGEHIKRRRIMGQLYNRNKIHVLEGVMLRNIHTFVAVLEEKATCFEAGSACRALEADIISDFSFGRPVQALEAWKSGLDIAMVQKNDEKATWMPLLMNYPIIFNIWVHLDHLVKRSASSSKASFYQGLSSFDQWTHKVWSDNFKKEAALELSTPNLVQTMVSSGVDKWTALSEAKENLGPGTDTTSASLAHILFALSLNPLYQQKLYEDIARVGFSTDMSVLENIPRLRALVKEGIRWAGAAAAMLPRIVPAGGIELHGKFIPEGTVMTSSPIWYLRDKEQFPEPELFDPYRWIHEDGATFKTNALRDRFYIPFSKGANICIGMHFSYYELYLGISQLLRRCHVQLDEDRNTRAPIAYKAHHDWHLVQLPSRKEWVAAVLNNGLFVKTSVRKGAE